MTVELIYDSDCPNVRKARANLVRALAAASWEVRWTEWDCGAPKNPTHVMGFGSPTILVNGKDVAGVGAGDTSPSCRLYRNGTGWFDGVPPVEDIAAALRNGEAARAEALHASSGWRSSLAAVPGVAFAFAPKLVCPACWPAYAGLLSAVGLGFLLSRAYLFVLTTTFLTLAVGALAFHAPTRRGYGPFAVGLAAGVAVLAGKFGIESKPALYGGIAGLLVGSVWNAWPVGLKTKCPACRTDSSFEVNSSFSEGDISIMATKRQIEVFSAGCPACEETIALVHQVSCASCEVTVLDMRQARVANRAKEMGIRSVPAVVIDGRLADCCGGRGPQESTLRAAGLGQPG